MTYDPVKLELFKNLYASVAEEMGVALCRTAFSPNIKERRDFSCAVFDASGNMIAHAAHIPVHLGSMPLSVSSAIQAAKFEAFEDGDIIILNDPFQGGSHLPDITLVSPIFVKEGGRRTLKAEGGRRKKEKAEGGKKPVFFVANRAHHSDVGGMSPGSMPLSLEIFQEGIRIPPVKILKKGILDRELFEIIMANVRTPVERKGDLEAQIAANQIGKRRLVEIVQKYGLKECLEYAAALLSYSERMMRSIIKRIPNGIYEFHDFMDDDGIEDKAVKIAVRISVGDEDVIVDFSGSAPQVKGSINSVYAITLSAVFYVFKCIAEAGVSERFKRSIRPPTPDPRPLSDIPANWGCMKPITVIAPEGSVVNAKFPAAVAGGNVETSQRIVDVLLGALSKAEKIDEEMRRWGDEERKTKSYSPHPLISSSPHPLLIPAASSGSMNNITIGGYDPFRNRPFAYYETIAGGMGARPEADGINAIHTHMTNTMNTPIEAIEYAYPMQVTQYKIRRGSGGKGKYRGGDGIVREMRLLCDAEVTILSDRRKIAPYSLQGGEPGKCGRNVLKRKGGRRKAENRIVGAQHAAPNSEGRREIALPSKVKVRLDTGDAIRIETPGGGGYGKEKAKGERRRAK